jgi:hypothetical protein
MYAMELIIAVTLVALLFVFIRISWTLKEIHDAMVASSTVTPTVKVDVEKIASLSEAQQQEAAESAIDPEEIVAVIAVANQALREAV